MLKFDIEKKSVADNEVVINGMSFGFLNDDDTKKLITIIRGFQSGVAMNDSKKSTPKSTESKSVRKVKVGYHISQWNGLFCISRGQLVDGKLKNAGWTKEEKMAINNAIKSLDGIITTRVRSDREFTAWGYKTEEEAIKMMATLPTEFTF